MQQQNYHEIVILKPTSVFLSFLAAQAPKADLPPLEVLQRDTTAYSIPKQDGEEERIDEIERHFPAMFRYEIRRWLGDEITNPIEGSSLDFLCCFKFEIHTHIVLLEDAVEEAKQLLCVRPCSVLLKWIRSSTEGHEEPADVIERVSLSKLSQNATVVAKNFENKAAMELFVKQNYHEIYNAEMSRMCSNMEKWPDINSYDEFNHYFMIEPHSHVIHYV